MKVKPICKHRVLAGFLTFFLIITLTIGGTFLSIRGGVFRGSNVKELMQVNGIDEIFAQFCDDIFDETLKEQELEWLLETDSYDEIKEEMITVFMECFFERQDSVNLDNVVDKMMNLLEETSDDIVDDVFDIVEKEAEGFDAKSNQKVQDIITTYNIDVDDEFYDKLNQYAADIDNLDEYRDEVEEKIDAEVIGAIESNEDGFRADLEKSFDEMLSDYYDSEAFLGLERVNGYLNAGATMIDVATLIMLGISLLFIILICYWYRKSIFGAFSKLAVAFGLSGLFVLGTGALKFLVGFIMDEFVAKSMTDLNDTVGIDIMGFINKLIDLMFNPFLIIGAIFMAIMFVSIIIWRITKNKFIR